jgi:hypothetical protein
MDQRFQDDFQNKIQIKAINILILGGGKPKMKEVEKTMRDAEEFLQAWKPTKIHFGEGAIHKAGEVVKNIRIKHSSSLEKVRSKSQGF